jgi:hypothetical protein
MRFGTDGALGSICTSTWSRYCFVPRYAFPRPAKEVRTLEALSPNTRRSAVRLAIKVPSNSIWQTLTASCINLRNYSSTADEPSTTDWERVDGEARVRHGSYDMWGHGMTMERRAMTFFVYGRDWNVPLHVLKLVAV